LIDQGAKGGNMETLSRNGLEVNFQWQLRTLERLCATAVCLPFPGKRQKLIDQVLSLGLPREIAKDTMPFLMVLGRAVLLYQQLFAIKYQDQAGKIKDGGSRLIPGKIVDDENEGMDGVYCLLGVSFNRINEKMSAGEAIEEMKGANGACLFNAREVIGLALQKPELCEDGLLILGSQYGKEGILALRLEKDKPVLVVIESKESVTGYWGPVCRERF
jgi:hypothetical protein